MWPSWVTVAIVQLGVLASLGLPCIFIESSSERIAFVMVAGVLLTVIVVALYVALVPAPLAEMANALERLSSPLGEFHVRLANVDPTTVAGTWTSTDPFADVVLSTLDAGESVEAMLDTPALAANSKHADIFEVQCRVRDAVRTLALQQRAISRATGATHPPSGTISRRADTEDDDLQSCRSYLTEGAMAHSTLRTSDSDAQALVQGTSPPDAPNLRRGARFLYDKPSICMYIERNKNGNLVIYEARTVPFGATTVLPESDPIDAYWLDIDEEIMARHRREGRTNDRHELKAIERKFAYGIKCKRLDENTTDPRDRRFSVKFVALDTVSFELKMQHCRANESEGSARHPVMVTTINGDEAIAERIYVKARETSWLPRVEYADLFGQRCSDGAAVSQRFLNT